MKKLLVAILGVMILNACTLTKQQEEEYEADHKAYQKCLEMEPNIDVCVYDYVKYLPKDIQNEMEE